MTFVSGISVRLKVSFPKCASEERRCEIVDSIII